MSQWPVAGYYPTPPDIWKITIDLWMAGGRILPDPSRYMKDNDWYLKDNDSQMKGPARDRMTRYMQDTDFQMKDTDWITMMFY